MSLVVKCADLFKALSHPTRIGIIQDLSGGERCVCEIQLAVEVTQPTMSKHVSVLRQAGLVACRQDGPRVLCRLASEQVKDLLRVGVSLVKERALSDAGLLDELGDDDVLMPGGSGRD